MTIGSAALLVALVLGVEPAPGDAAADVADAAPASSRVAPPDGAARAKAGLLPRKSARTAGQKVVRTIPAFDVGGQTLAPAPAPVVAQVQPAAPAAAPPSAAANAPA